MHGAAALPPARAQGFGWLGIVRIGLVQAAIGALVMLASTVLNRVMVVELGLAAAIPAGLVAWHYAVQLGRPLWGHASDKGNTRTLWIIGGLAVLAVLGNVVTAWSWFGVNMLGVGLHSYGFMDAAFWWLTAFVASQLIIIAVANLPLEKWRSFRLSTN